MDTIPQKRCSGCPEGQQWHPATLEFFPPEKKGKNGLSSRCRVCARARQKKHRSRPDVQERHAAYMKAYHARPDVQEQQRAYNRLPETRERMRAHARNQRQRPDAKARRREYYQRPEVKARMRTFYAQPEQKEQRRAYRQEYDRRPESQRHYHTYRQTYYQRPEVQERKNAWTKEYWKRPITRAKYQAQRQRRRAHLHKAVGSHTPEQIREQYQRQKGKCYYCRMKVAWEQCHVDHVIPLSRGGSNDISNIVIACPSCNLRKRDKLPHEFFDGGRLL